MDKFWELCLHPVAWPIAVTLLLGAVAYVAARPAPWLGQILALAGGLVVLVQGILLAGRAPLQVGWTWIRLTDRLAFQVDLGATPLGMVVVIGAGAFAVLIALYSFRAMAGRYGEGRFYAYVLWSLSGSVIVGLAGNLLVLLVGWELVTLTLYLMINLGRERAKAGAAKAYGILGFADACLLMAVALLVGQKGSAEGLSLTAGRADLAQLGAVGYAVYALILVAALAKAGAIPVHTWIPSIAEDAPTPVLAFLPASVDKLLGIYLLAVLTLRMFRPDPTMQAILMVIGAVTILAAVLMAMMQHNLKKLLAFHAVSQVGYMVLGIGTGTTLGVIGGLFHMINNAIYKSNLFLMSGTVRRAAGSDEIEQMGGLARALPVTFISGLIAAAAISGVPPFNGFVSKWLVYQGTLGVDSRGLAVALLVVAVFGSALTLASFVKVMHSAFLSPAPKGAAWAAQPPRESFWLAAPMVVLAAACVVLGLWPQLIVQRVLEPVAIQAGTTGPGLSVAAGEIQAGTLGLWNPTHATVLILLGILIGMVLVWTARQKSRLRIVRPFLAGEVPGAGDDRFRVPGTHYYETIARLPGLGPLLKHGQVGAMDLYHWFGRYGRTLIELLRAQHTGLAGLYVAWCVVGLTITLVYLLIAMGS